MKIILASASPRRRELLEQIGMEFEVKVSEVEEEYFQTEPEEIVKELALLKALDITQELEGDHIVIGADTVVVQDGEILGKPQDEEDAARMLRLLQGRSHMVYTGVAMITSKDGIDPEDGRVGFEFDIKNEAIGTKVFVSEMTEQEIHDYIATGEPMDKAGAYGIQGKFAVYVEKIEGDYYNVVGLPISYISKVCKNLGAF